MNKNDLIRAIIAQLRESVALGTSTARATAAAATDADSRAENKYDTRNLEASYLARGQAFRVAETMEALLKYEALRRKTWGPDDPVSEGALIALVGPDGEFHCFMGPAAGGMEVSVHGIQVTVITPESPLGSRLMGRRRGDQIELQPGRAASSARITMVQ